MGNHTGELINAALPYWEAEGEIARVFFASKPSREAHEYWLKAQLWKELHPVDGYFNGIHKELANLADMFPRVDTDIDRHHFAFLMRQMLEEFNHYVLFADILEFLTGRKLDLKADTIQLPEERKLGELRRSYVESGSPIDKAAVLFTEGGGARLFREGAKVKGGKLEEMIAAAMQVIYDDEKDHFNEGAEESAHLIRSREDLERMKAAIVAVSRQRVAMRMEMFGRPMSDAALQAFIERVRAETAAAA
jgi:hypothetical protein